VDNSSTAVVDPSLSVNGSSLVLVVTSKSPNASLKPELESSSSS